MLHYAYSRQLPVQIVVTDGKEAVISEKHLSAHFGQTLLVGYSDIIRSTVCENFRSCIVPHRPTFTACSRFGLMLQHGVSSSAAVQFASTTIDCCSIDASESGLPRCHNSVHAGLRNGRRVLRGYSQSVARRVAARVWLRLGEVRAI